MGWLIPGAIVGLIVGFIVGKFWNSRKINATVAAIKSDPTGAVAKIKEIWKI
jgi:hypothetical protein